jgi:exodeoxyribonuclease VII large subunit
VSIERPPASSRDRPIGVGELVRLAGRALDGIGLVWLEGEVAQVSRPASGHVYFALRERDAVVPAVMWGRDVTRLRFRLDAGQRVRVRGRLGVYDRDGKMQLYVDFAEPAGAGAEALALDQLKAKLAAEGVFAAERKRALPRFPRRIGVVTSKHGAAVHDIIRTIERRFPTPILVADCAVQGPTAPQQIVAAMVMVVRAGVDVVIVGRGGGAATDLTAWSNERLVRTNARCPVPVISAVGHETDLSLADLAADARALTPTAAAELAVPDRATIVVAIGKERRRLDREVRHAIDRARQDLDRHAMELHARGLRALGTTRGQLHELQRRLAALHPRARLANVRRDHDALVARRDAAMRAGLAARRAELARLGAQLHAMSPLAVLDRGYAMVQRGAEIVRDAATVRDRDRLRVRLARGALDVVVDASKPERES